MASVLKRGLTLAEVLLSLGLCVVTVLSSIALCIAALRSSTKSTDATVAEGRAAQVINEFVYGLPPSQDPFWARSGFTSPYQQDATLIGDKTYTAQLYLTPLTSAQGLLRCGVNVSWQGGQAGQAGQGIQVVEVARLIYGQ